MRSASEGAPVSTRVVMMLAIWSITTIPRLHAAIGPIVRRPMPRTPNFQWKRKPSLNSGMNRIIAWNATPSVHAPAVSAIFGVVHWPADDCAWLPKIMMNAVKPMQLITLAPTELHA